MDRSRLLLILALTVIAGLTRWWMLRVEEDAEGNRRLPPARSDYTLETFDLLVMDDSGHASFQVQSPYLEKNPADGSVEISRPVVHLFEEGKANWRVEAQNGWIREDGEELRLIGRVLLEQGGAPNGLTIRTQDLRIEPRIDRAHSEAPVQIERPGAILEGVGLEADLETRRMEILSEVTGNYEPSKT